MQTNDSSPKTESSRDSADNLIGRLANLDTVTTKKMFGGYGIFSAQKMFALIDSDGRVFFKVDPSNQSRYDGAGSPKHARMPYYLVPDEVMRNDESLIEWARISIEISHRGS